MSGPDIFDVPPARTFPLNEIVDNAGPLLGHTLKTKAAAAQLPAGQQRTILEAKLMAAAHPSLHAYANLKCRCEPCVTMWNVRYRTRARAAARLIEAHREEFDAYLADELERGSA